MFQKFREMKQERLFLMKKYKIIQFVNPYKNANTFVVEIGQNEIVIIDFGNYPIDEFLEWIRQENKIIIGLILTHEHADHCYGVDKLMNSYNFKLYCSEKCETNMRNPKQNYSRYIDDFETFGVISEAIIVNEGQILDFNGFRLKVLETPGHSPGSICLLSDDIIFTGDTILNNVKSPLSFPHSNKIDYSHSFKRILNTTEESIKFFPGHGEPFIKKDIDWDYLLES